MIISIAQENFNIPRVRLIIVWKRKKIVYFFRDTLFIFMIYFEILVFVCGTYYFQMLSLRIGPLLAQHSSGRGFAWAKRVGKEFAWLARLCQLWCNEGTGWGKPVPLVRVWWTAEMGSRGSVRREIRTVRLGEERQKAMWVGSI